MSLQRVLKVAKLQGQKGHIDTSSLEGKTLFIYFSAHWCPPCRAFTPVLAQLYREQKEKRSDFEVVFASWDQSQEEFDGYFKEHPWLAIPFEQRAVVESLQSEFGVQSIPTLILLNSKGDVLTKKARYIVVEDPKGADFPWTSEEAMKKYSAAEAAAGEAAKSQNLTNLAVLVLAIAALYYVVTMRRGEQ